MCSVTAAVLGVSLAAGAYSAKKQADAANSAADLNALIASNNAKIADIKAQDAIKRGQRAESNYRREVSQLKGKQRAAASASGALVDSGSFMDTLKDTQKFGDIDAMTLRQNAAQEAWGFSSEASNLRTKSKMILSQKYNPWEAAGTSLLTSGSQIGAVYALNRR